MTARHQLPWKSNFRSVLAGASGVVVVILILAGYEASRDLARLKAREELVERRLLETDARIDSLRERIDRVRTDPMTLERLAREQLGLARPTDVVFLFEDRGEPTRPSGDRPERE